MRPPTDALDRARRDASLSQEDLWLRYFALGGMTMPLEVEAYLFGPLRRAAAHRARPRPDRPRAQRTLLRVGPQPSHPLLRRSENTALT